MTKDQVFIRPAASGVVSSALNVEGVDCVEDWRALLSDLLAHSQTSHGIFQLLLRTSKGHGWRVAVPMDCDLDGRMHNDSQRKDVVSYLCRELAKW